MFNKISNSFLRHIFILASGSVAAQFITAISVPLLTRIFSPEVLGLYTYVISFAAIFLSVSNARFEVPIVTDSDDANIYPLIKLSLIIGVIVSFISLCVSGVCIYTNGLPYYLPIYVFFSVLAFSIINVLNAYNNRQKEYKLISSVYVFRTSAQNIGGIILGLLQPIVHCLLIPYIIGYLFGINRQIKTLRYKWGEIMNVPLTSIKKVAYKHKKQLFFSTPALLSNSLSYSIITIFVESLYGLEAVGYYSMSVKLLGLPLALFSGNVSKVFIERASNEYREYNKYRVSFKSTFKFLLCIAIPMVIILILWSTPICKFIFGNDWSIAGTYISILAPMFGIRMLTSALSPAFVLINKQGLEFALQSIFLASALISYIITKIYNLNIDSFILLISITYSISYLIYLYSIYKFSK